MGWLELEVRGSVHAYEKPYMPLSISGASKMVHFTTSSAHPTLTGPQKPLGEQSLDVTQPPAQEFLVEEERQTGFSIFQSPFQALSVFFSFFLSFPHGGHNKHTCLLGLREMRTGL